MRLHRLAFLALPFLLVVGCEKGVHLVKVSGRITRENRPLANAHVVFRFMENGKPDPDKESAGMTDEDGRYALKSSSSQREGAIPGTYRVEIHQIDRSGARRPGINELIPPEYNRDSKLTFTVPADGTSEANFDLKGK